MTTGSEDPSSSDVFCQDRLRTRVHEATLFKTSCCCWHRISSRLTPSLPPAEALSALEEAVAQSLAQQPAVGRGSGSGEREVLLSNAISEFVAHGSVGARLPRSAVVLGKAQSRLRVLRKEAVARVCHAQIVDRCCAAERNVPTSFNLTQTSCGQSR